MKANTEVESRGQALERALNLEPLHPSSPVRVGKSTNDGLEVRVDVFGGQKHILPVLWSDYPSRKTFADYEENFSSEGVSLGLDFKKIYVAANIPDPLAADLRRWQVNHADLNGRLFLILDGLFINRAPLTSKHRNPVAETSLFTAKASRIPRLLLSDRKAVWTQDKLVEGSKTSRGYVSRLLKVLVDEGYVTQQSSRGKAKSYQLRDFDRLLDAWVQADEANKRIKRVEYSILASDPSSIARLVRDALDGTTHCFTQWIAAWLRKAYTTPPVVSAYVTGDVITRFSLGRKVSSGGNLWLLVPEDRGVFQGGQVSDGFSLASDAQIYLDLINAGLRGPEAAGALRAWEGFACS